MRYSNSKENMHLLPELSPSFCLSLKNAVLIAYRANLQFYLEANYEKVGLNNEIGYGRIRILVFAKLCHINNIINYLILKPTPLVSWR